MRLGAEETSRSPVGGGGQAGLGLRTRALGRWAPGQQHLVRDTASVQHTGRLEQVDHALARTDHPGEQYPWWVMRRLGWTVRGNIHAVGDDDQAAHPD